MRFPTFGVELDECNSLAPNLEHANGWQGVHVGGDGSGSNTWVYSYGTQKNEEPLPQLIVMLGGGGYNGRNEDGAKGAVAFLKGDGTGPSFETFTLGGIGERPAGLNRAVASVTKGHAHTHETV